MAKLRSRKESTPSLQVTWILLLGSNLIFPCHCYFHLNRLLFFALGSYINQSRTCNKIFIGRVIQDVKGRSMKTVLSVSPVWPSLSHPVFKALSWAHIPFPSISCPGEPHLLTRFLLLQHLVKMTFQSNSQSPRTKYLAAECALPYRCLGYYSAHLKLT